MFNVHPRSVCCLPPLKQLKEIAESDNEVYRSVLGLEEISADEREAGSGGAAPNADFDVYNQSTAELLRWTSSKIDNLERRISIQKLSFEELKEAYNTNKDKLHHLPAIKPTSGILLSSFGMREHPVLGYPRTHGGADFRADIGSSVYSTANGKIKYVGLRGTLGRIIVIDHGYGYETLYAHLSSVPKEIKRGAEVTRGQLIGYSGNSGLTEGPHLHYELRDEKDRPINPMKFKSYSVNDTISPILLGVFYKNLRIDNKGAFQYYQSGFSKLSFLISP